jgi:S-adenosylmethionine-dependent methyltransferase
MSVTGTTLDSWKEAGVAADFRRDGVRFSLVWDVLRDVVLARVAETGRQALDIVDVGGGTGGLAVPFAAQGHNVTVVDPSPDALAAAQRRAAEAGARLTAVQGEAASLDSVAGTKSADLVICHNVLEYVDSPSDAMTAIAAVLRPSATVSVLASNAVAAVLHRALAGRFTEARQLLESEKAEEGSGSPRRFTLPALTALIEGAGLRAGEAHGLRIFSGLVPGALLDGDGGGTEALRELEAAAAATPPLRDIAAQLHVLGHR